MLRFKFLIIALVLIPHNNNGQLTELQKLKAENFQLRVKLGQCSASLSDRENRLLSIELTNEQNNLVNEFRETLKASQDDKFDWACLCFKPKN